ncbi:MAG: FadR/GntR family transcriptional regulator [Novosphingobium sp.]
MKAAQSKARADDRLPVRIAHDLGVAITSGRHAPGDTLEGEMEISERLHVSRTAYREAVRILAAKGMVESRQRTGTRILPRRSWHLLDPDVLAWSFETEPSEEFLLAVFELRLIIEPEAAALAAVRRSSRDLSRMGYALEQMERHEQTSEIGRAADQQFHNLVLEASGNELLVSLASTVGASIAWTTEFKHRRRKIARDARPDHLIIFDAIAEGSAEQARAAMRQHIRHSQAEAHAALGVAEAAAD